MLLNMHTEFFKKIKMQPLAGRPGEHEFIRKSLLKLKSFHVGKLQLKIKSEIFIIPLNILKLFRYRSQRNKSAPLRRSVCWHVTMIYCEKGQELCIAYLDGHIPGKQHL